MHKQAMHNLQPMTQIKNKKGGHVYYWRGNLIQSRFMYACLILSYANTVVDGIGNFHKKKDNNQLKNTLIFSD